MKQHEEAVKAGFQEYQKLLEGPWGGSRLPNGLPVGRYTGELRRNATLQGSAPVWTILNRASHWKFIRDGARSLKARGRIISDRIINKIRGLY